MSPQATPQPGASRHGSLPLLALIGVFAFADAGVYYYRRLHPPAASAPAAVAMPDLRGRSLDDAERALRASGFAPPRVCGSRGLVRETVPDATRPVSPGTVVRLDLMDARAACSTP